MTLLYIVRISRQLLVSCSCFKNRPVNRQFEVTFKLVPYILGLCHSFIPLSSSKSESTDCSVCVEDTDVDCVSDPGTG